MKFIAFIVVAAAWACLFLAPKSSASRVLQLLVFGVLGALFTIAGGFSYWWDSGMRPSQTSPFIFICGVLTLTSQASTFIRGLLENEGGTPWPDRPSKRK